MRSACLCILGICLAFMAGCSAREQSTERVAPRPRAYPRAMVYDSAYILPDSLPLRFEANAQAVSAVEIKDGGAVWLTVSYPAYDAELMCTFTPVTPATVNSVVDNRLERMQLNINGLDPQVDVVASDGGYSGIVVFDPNAVSTPVQFIAYAANPTEAEWVVSGSAFFEKAQAGAPLDSLAPMVQTMLRDVRHSVSGLK